MSKEQIKQVFNHSAASALVVLGEPKLYSSAWLVDERIPAC